MTTRGNRLAKPTEPEFARPNTLQGWCDYANEHLASIGRAHELEWVILNGTTHIQWRR